MDPLPIHHYDKGDVIFREGDSPNGVFLIRRGRITLTRGETVLDQLGKNSFFGEMALVDNRLRSATATAAEDTECVRITSADFQKRMAKLEPLMQGIFRVLVERMRTLNDRLAEKEGE